MLHSCCPLLQYEIMGMEGQYELVQGGNLTSESTPLLPVMEHFHTLQGEGAFSGHASYFVRLGGCDVGCHWCDVKESWDASLHPKHSIAEIISWVEAARVPFTVITGGEPLMHDLTELTQTFHNRGLRLHVETSGTSPLTGTWDWITLSPKKFKPALDEYYPAASELKIVVSHPSDLAWAETHADRVGQECKLLLQPEWDRRARIMPMLVDFVKANPRWAVSLQTHKYLEIP
jgi:7-carboxy-7-deazaguanine synthase